MMLVSYDSRDFELCRICGAYCECGHDKNTEPPQDYEWLKVETDAFILAMNEGVDWTLVEDLAEHGSKEQLRRIAASQIDDSEVDQALAANYETKLRQRFPQG